jgi:ferredoxin
MNILNLIADNWMRGPQTHRFPERHVPAPQYRGCVDVEPDVCVTCGICERVCVSAAIKVEHAEDHCTWTYDPARCTFCGVCVADCPVGALTQASDRGESCTQPGQQAVTAVVVYPMCPECGKPAQPYSPALLGEAFGDLTPEMSERAHLCEHCRQKATMQAMKDTFVATGDTERTDHGR